MFTHRAMMHTLDVGAIGVGATLLAKASVVAGYITPIGGALLVVCGLVVYAWRFWVWLQARLARKAG